MKCDCRKEAIAGDGIFRAEIAKHECAGAIGTFRITAIQATVSDQRSLLVTQAPGNANAAK